VTDPKYAAFTALDPFFDIVQQMRCRLGVHKPPFPAHSHGHPTQEPPPMWRFVYAYPDVPPFAARGSPNNCSSRTLLTQ
jgi:hypothetical protein